ncbi:MAG TPA: NAD(P)H-dependent oxidoreductase subunit E [bacterium]|nr:NAD(P)H-dependent oxidoreductase subunit E [bacterium]
MSTVAASLKKIEPDRSNLIKALQAVQEEEGYISNEAIAEVARHFTVSAVEVEGVVSFYAQFKRVKPGKFKISVCDGTACHIKGASLVTGWISDELGIKGGETDNEGLFSLEIVACLGCCSLAPVISINGKVYGNLDRKGLLKILKDHRKGGAA